MLVIERESGEQIYHQLYRQLRAEIETGIRQPGQQVASTRYLAQTLAVSRNTVDHAYQDLVAEGYLVSKPGAGYRVAQQLPVLTAAETPLQPVARPQFAVDFTEDFDHLQLFPKTAWQAAERAVMWSGVTHIQPASGDAQYRQQVTQYLARLKGIHVTADQIVVTSGFNEAAGIIANLVPEFAQGRLAVAEPIAPNAREVWQKLGVATVNYQKAWPDATGYVLAPTHNFPDGQGLTVSQRQRLAQRLRATQRYLIELDTDGTMVYDGQPAPALYHDLAGQRSFYYTNYDDTLGSALCMGILVLPTGFADRYQQTYGRLPNRNSQWQQQILGRMIANDSLERFIRQLTIVYRNRRQLLITTLQQAFGDRIRITGAAAGSFIVVQLSTTPPISHLIAQAAAVGVGLVNPDRCWANGVPADHSVVLSFRQVTDDQIVSGVRALAQAWHLQD
ncbi:aminotransferase-like domain-containing protein [Levilactobacillus yiduensis]|uniref:aminotransferase-like domain-containing protein n=1 Tax=Levilactobacillus yiduensis TaxID=2953880 RepID=UPI000EF2EDEA|nr:PLP-dependent aminotransferase family protein [Levilactobacillus yiduensis]AYM01819.1 PLP-dependent aminotransferase family protein [Levilactobacillus brevis]